MKIPDFKLKESKDEEGKIVPAPTNGETTLNVLHLAIVDAHSETKNTPQGEQKVSTLTGSQGRMWGRIQRKMDDIVDTKETNVDLDETEVDFLLKALDKAVFPHAYYRHKVLIEDALEDDRAEAKKKAEAKEIAKKEEASTPKV